MPAGGSSAGRSAAGTTEGESTMPSGQGEDRSTAILTTVNRYTTVSESYLTKRFDRGQIDRLVASRHLTRNEPRGNLEPMYTITNKGAKRLKGAK